MNTKLAVGLLLSFILFPAAASAHYLWVTIDSKVGDHGSAKIYFEEGPGPGDGHYLDHFKDTRRTWFRTVEKIEPSVIETEDVTRGDHRWLQAELPDGAPRSIDCYGKFGVYQYGETFVLLHYYARYLDVSAHEDLHELGRSEHMDLDLVAHDFEDKVTVRVLWRDEPAAERTVFIRGPQRFRQNLKTNARGRVTFEPPHPGQYTIRTSVEEDIAGTDGGQEYSLIRHNATLIMKLPLEQ